MRRWLAIAQAVAAVALGLATQARAQYAPPTHYYDTATGTGITLRTNLHNIITSGFVGRSYGDARYAMGTGDSDGSPATGGTEDIDYPNNSANILLVYNRASILGKWDAGATWNREHTWPKFWLNLTSSQVSNTYVGVASDAFELRPSNPGINSSRSDYGYGYYPQTGTNGTLHYGTNSNGGTTYWYAGDADRGDVAREMFYMATRWFDPSNPNRGTSNANLELKHGAPVLFNLGDLNSLLHWNADDPVDDFERRRNQYIYGSSGDLTNHALNPTYYQGNRNPFVDHPEWVNQIFDGCNVTLSVAAPAADGSSSTTVSLGRIMKNQAFTSGTATLSKQAGSNQAGYDVTVNAGASSTSAGTNLEFDSDAVALVTTRSISANLTASTSTTGIKTGSLTVHNKALSSNGAGLGSADADDTINVTGTVVDNRVITASSVDFGRIIINSPQAQTSTLQSLGADTANTRVTVNGTTVAADANGVSIPSGSSVIYDGTTTSGMRQVQASFTSAGNKSGSRTFSITGEGLTGEAPVAVNVSYSGIANDHAAASFVSGSTSKTASINFGYVTSSLPTRSKPFSIYNRDTTGGFNAALDLDGKSASGSSVMTNDAVAPSGSPLAAGPTPWNSNVTYTPDANVGLQTTTHTFSNSDENIPGATSGTNLVLTTTGRTFTASTFPASDFFEILTGETFNTGAFSIGGGVTLTKTGAGTMNVNAAQSNGATSTLAVSDGTVNMSTDAGSAGGAPLAVTVSSPTVVNFSSTQHLRSLNVSGGRANVTSGGSKLIVTSALSSTGGKIDLTDNDMIVLGGDVGTWNTNTSSYSGITKYVADGQNGGDWNGNGIISSMPDAQTHLTTVGIATAGDAFGILSGTRTWDGETVGVGDVLLKYTYAGDADLNGKINGDDYFRIDQGYIDALSGYVHGDFDYNGHVDSTDYFIIDSNYQNQTAVLAPALRGTSAVPEPATAGAASFAGAMLLLRRRKRHQVLRNR